MMKEPVVAVVGAMRERHSLYLAGELERQGARALILDTSPEAPFPLTLCSEGIKYECFYHEQVISQISAFFLRMLFVPSPAFVIEQAVPLIERDGYVAYAAQKERYASWLSLLQNAESHGRHVINPINTLMFHFAKPFQIELLRQHRIPVPATLVTSDAEALHEFARGRDVVYKPVAGGALCRRLEKGDFMPERLQQLTAAPVLFQEYIPGKDLRIFVLDGKVIASFYVEGEGIDYRAGAQKVIPANISENVAEICTKACSILGLLFSGVDVKLQEDGTVVLLECNPAPMFEGFDQVAPVTVVSQLAEHLIAMAIKVR